MRAGRMSVSAPVLQAFLVATVMMAWQVAAKTVRDSLFLSAYDPVTALPPMMVAASAASILVALLSTKLLHRYGPSRVIPISSLLGVLLNGAEYVLFPKYPGPVAIAVYLHVVAIGSVVLSGFWAMANERFDPREARKRFGQIAAFGTVGVLLGGVLTGAVSHVVSNSGLLLLVGALQLLCTLALFAFAAGGTAAAGKLGSSASLPDIISEAPYLAGLATLVLLAAMSASMLDFLFKSSAKVNFAKGAPLTGFLALFNTLTAVITFAVQVGGSKMWLKRFGPGKTVATLPVAVTGATLAAMFAPGLIALTVSRAIELLLRGSLYRAGYELFYTPMPPSQKRSVKSVIDIGAERLGDGLAGASVKLLAMLPGSSSVILGFTAMISAVGAWLAFRLDRAYVQVLEKGLANSTITLRPDQIEDPLTQSVFLKTAYTMARPKLESVVMPVGMAAPNPVLHDPVLERLAELRSGDLARIVRVLQSNEELHPMLVSQVIELLDRDDVAQTAYQALTRAGGRIAGQLVDALGNQATPYNIRKRIPKVLASCQNRAAWEGLIAHLSDDRFDVRARCARALEKILEKKPEFRPQPNAIFEIVQQELSATERLSRSQHGGVQMEEVLKDRAAKSIAHIFTLLGLVLPPQPVRLSFRALRAEDRKLHGVALEYLDSVLPRALREQLAAYFERSVAAPKVAPKEEDLAKLLDLSPSIVQKRERPRATLPGSELQKESTASGV